MFDTHCHLNFSRFKKNYAEVVDNALKAGVTHIMAPGTDIATSQKAIEVANQFDNVYAAVGIHPHHVYEYRILKQVQDDLEELERMVQDTKVLAIGEIGMDRHVYENTKYETYNVDEKFIDLQKLLVEKQIKLAKKYKKSLILHNREAKSDILQILNKYWDSQFEYRSVFHCCEPDDELLQFAQDHKMFIGVDGDLTYWQEKQEHIKKVPLEMLVLETDSPFLLPEPLKSQRLYPNEPKNIPIIAQKVADLKNISLDEVKSQTFRNSLTLFGLDS